MGRLNLTVAVLITLSLSACATLSIGTIWALKNVTITNVDPAIARVAVGFSDQMIIKAVTVESRLGPGEEEESITFDMAVLKTEAERDRVPFKDTVLQYYVFAAPQDRIDDIRGFQQAIIEERENGGKTGDGSLSLNFNVDLQDRERDCSGRIDKLTMTSAVLVDEEQGYVPLTRGSRLSRLIESVKGSLCSPDGEPS